MLIIEDGTGKVDSQSYATVAELAAYAAGRGVALPATEPEQEALLINASDFLESLAIDPGFLGVRKTRAQALAWPRTGVAIDGFDILDTEIPRELKLAQMQLAIDSMTVELLPTAVAPTTGAVIEETVEGAVSVKYDKPGAVVSDGLLPGATLARASAFVRPLLRSELPLFQIPVGRA